VGLELVDLELADRSPADADIAAAWAYTIHAICGLR
jgi:hypothetical protein